jgi:hypothetical protein
MEVMGYGETLLAWVTGSTPAPPQEEMWSYAFIGNSISKLSEAAASFFSASCLFVAEKVSLLFQSLLPILNFTSRVLQSPIGTSMILLSVALLVMKKSQYTQNRELSIAGMILGLALTIFSGIYITQSGLIPISSASFKLIGTSL